MSCEECETKQNVAFNKNIAETTGIAYVRIDVSNMAIVGCEKHCRELIDRLRKGDLK